MKGYLKDLFRLSFSFFPILLLPRTSGLNSKCKYIIIFQTPLKLKIRNNPLRNVHTYSNYLWKKSGCGWSTDVQSSSRILFDFGALLRSQKQTTRQLPPAQLSFFPRGRMSRSWTYSRPTGLILNFRIRNARARRTNTARGQIAMEMYAKRRPATCARHTRLQNLRKRLASSVSNIAIACDTSALHLRGAVTFLAENDAAGAWEWRRNGENAERSSRFPSGFSEKWTEQLKQAKILSLVSS